MHTFKPRIAPKFYILICALLILTPLGWLSAEATEPNCTSFFWDEPFESKSATAAFFANYRESAGSISFESKEIFGRAETKAPSLPKQDKNCPPGCSLRDIPYLLFQSSPSKFLSEYKDRQHCTSLHTLTSKQPLRYITGEITSVEDLSSWIGQLSQGKGRDGKDLYARCDRSCSPRYEYLITKLKRGDINYIATASVICSDARDKDDNMYELKSFFRWRCESTNGPEK